MYNFQIIGYKYGTFEINGSLSTISFFTVGNLGVFCMIDYKIVNS